MTRPFDPQLWKELERDAAPFGLVQRRILPRLRHDAFIAEQRPSRLRQLSLSIYDHLPASTAHGPRTRGLDVHLDISTEGLVRLDLTSTSLEANGLFTELAEDIAGVLQEHPEEGVAARVLERVIAWQTFFSRRGDEMGTERAAGLFAELEVLKTVLIPAVGSVAAVTAWHGPDPALQDFQFAGLAIEVKSFRGNGSGRLMISSERQLDTAGAGRLYVAYLRLDQRAEGTGITLADQVKRIKAATSGSYFASDLLDRQLIAAGWHESVAEARTEKFDVRSSEIFCVDETFPRLVATDLPNGIAEVSYSVDRAAIEQFFISSTDFLELLREK